MHYKMNKTSALKVPLVSIFHFHYHLIWWDYIAWFYDGFNWSSLILCNAHMLDNYFLKSRCYCFHEKCLFNMAYSCNKINFDNRWSDAHFVSFLFYYYCKKSSLFFFQPNFLVKKAAIRVLKIRKKNHWPLLLTVPGIDSPLKTWFLKLKT